MGLRFLTFMQHRTFGLNSQPAASQPDEIMTPMFCDVVAEDI
jgi:hypothetical protein